MLHELEDAVLPTLDVYEGHGMIYQREQVEVVCEDGTRAVAFAYVGLEECRVPGLEPSRRYLELVLDGAREMQLDAAWIARLAALPVHEPPELGPFLPDDAENLSEYSLDEISDSPKLFAFGGWVFDGAKASRLFLPVVARVSGQEISERRVRRMLESTGCETLEEILERRLSPALVRQLEDQLHGWADHVPVVGKLKWP